ncbi:MAG: hypothetical protein JKY58_13870 [Pseudomonas sp.]|nr:hypothetical protein [Pseudomonas sp.]
MPDRFLLTTLLGREFVQTPRHLEHMLGHLLALEELCRSLGVSRISEFVDISLLELDEAASLLEHPPVQAETDPETGMVLAIEDLAWHPAALGMASLEACAQHLARGSSSLIDQADVPGLLEELHLCLSQLQPLEAQGGQFHFSVRNL